MIIPIPIMYPVYQQQQQSLPLEGNFLAFIEAHKKLAEMQDTNSYSRVIFAMLGKKDK